MYEELKKNNFIVDIRNRDYMFLKTNKSNFNGYRHWDKLLRRIISI